MNDGSMRSSSIVGPEPSVFWATKDFFLECRLGSVGPPCSSQCLILLQKLPFESLQPCMQHQCSGFNEAKAELFGPVPCVAVWCCLRCLIVGPLVVLACKPLSGGSREISPHL